MEEIEEKIAKKGYIKKENSLNSIRDWLRKEKKLHVDVYYSVFHKKWFVNNTYIDLKKSKLVTWDCPGTKFDNHDNALLLALEYLIKHI